MRRFIPMLVVVLAAMLALSGAAFAQGSPAVTVSDQAADGNAVVVAQVVATDTGWIVIHESKADGTFGGVIGKSAVRSGTNDNVRVTLDRAPVNGEKLWAMLHVDTGTVGTYEFGTVEGADGPVVLNGDIVMQPFTVSVSGQAAATATMTATAVAATATPAAATTTETMTATATTTSTAPSTLPTTGGEGGFDPLLGLLMALVGAVLLGAVFFARPVTR